MQTRKLGQAGPEVSAIGLGCMAMSGMYGPADRAEAVATVRTALDAGVTLFDTGDFYGMGHNELLLAEALKGVPRDSYQLSVKFGALRDPAGNWLGNDTRPAALKNFLAQTLHKLGVDHIDIYRPARLDPQVPIEDTVGAIAECIQAGWVRYVGLSEVGAETLRRASTIHPVCDLQIEYALVTRGIEAEILPACRELGIGVTAYGVFSRGLLTGGWQPGRPAGNDFRNHAPRFQGEAGERNLSVAARLSDLAAGFDLTAGQLALVWVLAQGEDIVPLVGARRPDRVIEATAALARSLSVEELAQIEAEIPPDALVGERYAPAQIAMLDSER